MADTFHDHYLLHRCTSFCCYQTCMHVWQTLLVYAAWRQSASQAGRQTRLKHHLIHNTQLLSRIQNTGLSNSASRPYCSHIHQCSLTWQICWQNLVALCGSAELAQGKSGSETLSCKASGKGGVHRGSGCQGCLQRPPRADVVRPGSLPCCLQDAGLLLKKKQKSCH